MKYISQKIGTEYLPNPEEDGFNVECISFVVSITAEELQRLLSLYDPASATSPLAADCRPLVRAILDAAL